jgi:hypothetical protein
MRRVHPGFDACGMGAQQEVIDETLLQTSDEGLREQALRRVKRRRDFATHAFIYTLVNAAIWTVWVVIGLTSDSWWPWPVFPTLAWGIGLAADAWDVHVRKPITEESITREMERLRRGA